MNTIELTSVLRKRTTRDTNFLGVRPCDQLPKTVVCKLPAMLVVNTDPSDKPGQHWLGIYITENKHGLFFDSFGHPPSFFPQEINHFLLKNCVEMYHSAIQVQNNHSTTCGQHCVFFLWHIQKKIPYSKVLNMYGPNLVCNDTMVTHFVSRIHPYVCHDQNFKCVQCSCATYR